MTTDATSTYICARCQAPVQPEDVVFCRTCGSAHHVACWNEFGACSSPGCVGTQAVQLQGPAPMQPMGMVPPPPQVMDYGFSAEFEFGLSPAINAGWEAVQRNMGTAILGMLVYCAIIIPLSLIPFVNYLYQWFIAPAFIGGMVMFSLKLLNNSNPAVGDVFSGFQKYLNFLGTYWLYMVVMIGAGIPVGIGCLIAFLGMHLNSGNATTMPAAITLIVVTGLITLVLMTYLFTRFAFAFYLVADGNGIIEAFQNSWAMTEEKFWSVLGIGIILYIIGGAGAVACGVGMLFTYPICLCGFASQYVALRNKTIGVIG